MRRLFGHLAWKLQTAARVAELEVKLLEAQQDLDEVAAELTYLNRQLSRHGNDAATGVVALRRTGG